MKIDLIVAVPARCAGRLKSPFASCCTDAASLHPQSGRQPCGNHRRLQAPRLVGNVDGNYRKGVPDAIVGKFGHTYLVEMKDGSKPPSRRRLTADEELFWREWRGSLVLIESIRDVIEFNRKRTGKSK